MKYDTTDRVIRIGDKITYAGEFGVIAFVVDDDQYSDEFPKEHWSYLGKGFMIKLENGTLIHFDDADEDLSPVQS